MRSPTVTVDEAVRFIDIAVDRYRDELRAKVRSLPTNDEDGMWIQQQVLRFLNEVPTDRGVAQLGSASPQSAAATSEEEGHRVEAGSG